MTQIAPLWRSCRQRDFVYCSYVTASFGREETGAIRFLRPISDPSLGMYADRGRSKEGSGSFLEGLMAFS